MDLLAGYGSDDDDDVSSASSAEPAASAPTKAPTAPTNQPKVHSILKSSKYQTKSQPVQNDYHGPSVQKKSQDVSSTSTSKATMKKPGKRILSLGAVLPPEIFDRLTRGPQVGSDDSSVSSTEEEGGAGGNGSGGGGKKRKRRRAAAKDENNGSNNMGAQSAGDRSELNSLLSELRSTPLHVKAEKSKAEKTKSESVSLKSKDKDPVAQGKNEKLGMAFMSFTTTTNSTRKKNDPEEVVDVHAAGAKSSVSKVQVEDVESEEEDGSFSSAPTNTAKPAAFKSRVTAPSMSFSRMSAAAPIPSAHVRNGQPQQSAYPTMQADYPAAEIEGNDYNDYAAKNYDNNNNPAMKSRKQKRDEERALRSGQAFSNSSGAAATTELYQPSPTEFAPSAHAAAIASRAARYRGLASVGGGGGEGGGGGGGKGGLSNIAMYDPQAGTDVKGVGVTAKHKSKHQINQLMASAISLEAHRAAEAELAKFGGGGGKGNSSRADAKRKYGW